MSEIKTSKEFNIQEQAVVQATTPTKSEEKAEEGGGNVSLHILEVGAQPIKVYGEIKDIVNSAGDKQINIVNAKQMVDQKKPILENIPKAKAEEYKKRLVDKGAKRREYLALNRSPLFKSLPDRDFAQEQKLSYHNLLYEKLPKLLNFYFPAEFSDYNNNVKIKIEEIECHEPEISEEEAKNEALT
ncbi:11522_t:CDS:2 [Ambispora leptoticha]|uniref:11522_t:CDS:1 n=1 Tax=Ambispora leptoticha TaxID=144679 RepID=A0A9N8V6S7_9GLOM|nr:11522_t:CDS:2 [Ambispora leptoticha]